MECEQPAWQRNKARFMATSTVFLNAFKELL